MNQKPRTTNLLVAGTLMSLLVAAFFLFDSSSIQKALAAQFPGMALTANEDTTVNTDATAVDPQMITIVQDQNAALRATIQTMQTREDEYRATIEKANHTLQQMERNTSAKLAASRWSGAPGISSSVVFLGDSTAVSSTSVG